MIKVKMRYRMSRCGGTALLVTVDDHIGRVTFGGYGHHSPASAYEDLERGIRELQNILQAESWPQEGWDLTTETGKILFRSRMQAQYVLDQLIECRTKFLKVWNT